MLTDNCIQIIKSTVPVLEVHGTAITRRFYERMFAEHPELLNIFNHANLVPGDGGELAGYEAGQYVSVRTNIPGPGSGTRASSAEASASSFARMR